MAWTLLFAVCGRVDDWLLWKLVTQSGKWCGMGRKSRQKNQEQSSFKSFAELSAYRQQFAALGKASEAGKTAASSAANCFITTVKVTPEAAANVAQKPVERIKQMWSGKKMGNTRFSMFTKKTGLNTIMSSKAATQYKLPVLVAMILFAIGGAGYWLYSTISTTEFNRSTANTEYNKWLENVSSQKNSSNGAAKSSKSYKSEAHNNWGAPGFGSDYSNKTAKVSAASKNKITKGHASSKSKKIAAAKTSSKGKKYVAGKYKGQKKVISAKKLKGKKIAANSASKKYHKKTKAKKNLHTVSAKR